VNPKDRAARALAATTIVKIGTLQHEQDHRLSNSDQRKLSDAKRVLSDLMHRIEKDITA